MRKYLLAGLVLGLCAVASQSTAGVKVVIDKSDQLMLVWENGVFIHAWLASTGKKSSYTPTGTFHPTRFYAGVHASAKYGKNMYWAVYYEHKGVRAVHGVDDKADLEALGDVGTSMGCTHLTPENAKTFYHLVQKYPAREVTITIQE